MARFRSNNPKPSTPLQATRSSRSTARLAKNRDNCWLSDTRVAGCVTDVMRVGDTEGLYELIAWVIMPNHVHVLLLPKTTLAKITQSIKGRSARECNLLLGRSGLPFWEHESYDHWVRDEEQFNRIVEYIEGNPVMAGFAARPEDWRWSSAARAS